MMRHIYITSPQKLPHTLSDVSKKSGKRGPIKKFFLYALQAIVASSTGTRDKLYQHLKLYRQALEFSQSNLDKKENANMLTLLLFQDNYLTCIFPLLLGFIKIQELRKALKEKNRTPAPCTNVINELANRPQSREAHDYSLTAQLYL